MSSKQQNAAEPASRSTATYALALGLFALAASIVYFSWTLAAYRQDIPDILEHIEQTSDKIEPVVAEVARVRDAIPPILQEVAEVRAAIPPILAEIAAVREQLPAILAEVKASRKQVPAVLDEVAATREALPQVAAIVDDSAKMVDQTVTESAAIRALTPDVLAEVKATREAIPPTLDRVDALMGKASEMGREASSGAVTGFFKGIITAPFVIVGNAGQSVFGMSKTEVEEMPEEDMATLTKVSNEVLSMTAVNAFETWDNVKTGISGRVTLVGIESNESQDCRVLHVQVLKRGRKKFSKNLRVCRNEDGLWERAGE